MTLDTQALLPKKSGELSPLLAAIDETRKGQAEVSAELGERVRKAVELLIQAHAVPLDAKGGELARNDVYLAAVRMVMRMVVILFAEARDLLPRDNALYFGSYGLQGLRESLRRAAGGRLERLRTRHGAWPRVLALFRLVYEGSPHRALPVPRYGGELFRQGSSDGDDGIRKAVHLFETACFQHEVSDAVIYQMLELITTTHVRVRQGTAAKVVPVPVNFADLSTEYIGMLYEGLLGYELRRVEEEDEAIVILKLGDEPALPLRRLEAMSDKTLSDLVDKFKQKAAVVDVSEDDEESEEEPEAETTEEESEGETPEAEDSEEEPVEVDSRQVIRDRAVGWAKRAVVAGKLVTKPKAKKGNAEAEYAQKISEKAKQITGAAYLPGQYFLIRSSGTRKGSGTFYTRPALAIPTTQRTLRPLAWIAPDGEDGTPNELAPVAEWAPRKPEEILALKVCDPACGSASFLVAALRFLTDSLYASLHHHGRIREHGDGALITLAEGMESAGVLAEETLPSRPDDPSFEARLKARLKRYVVERCIYGVDYDRLAIELARMALWIETMDRELPFEFLDHKVKHGNALVGTWFDQFTRYPILAWDREGGDKGHTKFVHHLRTTKNKQGKEIRSGDPWNAALKDFFKNTAKPRYREWLDGQTGLWDQVRPENARKQHEEAVGLFEQLHAIPVQDSEARAEFYRDKIAGSESYRKLKDAFDTWCAIWFWPPDKLQYAPVATGAVDAEQLKAIVARVRRDLHFFHWELEFPDVFREAGSGFDAVLGNPPWEISKPNSKEFFSRIDPLYRSYGKQEALEKQQEYFTRSAQEESEWIRFNDFFKAMSNWTSHAASPFGDGAANGEVISFSRSPAENQEYRRLIESRRSTLSFADPRNPFRHQGSADLNLYKLFLEVSHAVTRSGGRFGMIVPSGIYTDKGTTELRRLFLDECHWRWLFGFENRAKIFDIDSRFKFNPVIVEKGGSTDAILTAFMRRDVRDWEEAEHLAIPYPREQIERFSPRTRALVEIQHDRDLAILEKIYSQAITMGDQTDKGWGFRYAREFDMANDSKLFSPLPRWQEQGYLANGQGRWLGVNGERAVALYQGVMIHQYDYSYKGWRSGTGLRARWDPLPWGQKRIEPQYLMPLGTYTESGKAVRGLKVAFRDIARSTDERTFIGSIIPDAPCGHTIGVLDSNRSHSWVAIAILNSFVFDWVVRKRMPGTHLTWSVLEELPFPAWNDIFNSSQLKLLVARLLFASDDFLDWWREFHPTRHLADSSIRELWAVSGNQRRAVRIGLNAIAAMLFAISPADLADIFEDCWRSPSELCNRNTTSTFRATGFWRVDADMPAEVRETAASHRAFCALYERVKEVGAEQALNDYATSVATSAGLAIV